MAEILPLVFRNSNMATTQSKLFPIFYNAKTIYILSDKLQAYVWNSDDNIAEINFNERCSHYLIIRSFISIQP